VVYTQRKILPSGRKAHPIVMSPPDIISELDSYSHYHIATAITIPYTGYNQSIDTGQDLLFTDIKINSNEQVYNLEMEFSGRNI